MAVNEHIVVPDNFFCFKLCSYLILNHSFLLIHRFRKTVSFNFLGLISP